MKRARFFVMGLALLVACGGGLRHPELGPVPAYPDFADDPATPAKLALGRALFSDARLSGSGHTSCASCHLPATHFQDNLPLSTPDRSYPNDSPTLKHNTLSLENIAFAPVFRWDGSSTDLVDVSAFPLAEPNMNVARLSAGDFDDDVPAAKAALFAKLTGELSEYAPQFEDAFGVDVTKSDPETVWRLFGRAIRATYVDAVARDSAFDRWNAGDDSAMDPDAQRGLDVFLGKGRCVACHGGPMFTDYRFHNISTAGDDPGRMGVTGDPADRGKFLTPTLRAAYDTSPYFHDGSAAGLRDAIAHIASPAVVADPNHDPLLDPPPALEGSDVDALVAFIRALRSST